MPRLENWKIVTLSDGFTPPELQDRVIKGQVYDHPDYEDGESIITSAPAAALRRDVITKTGTLYTLGEIDPEYLSWLEANDQEWDPDNPIRI